MLVRRSISAAELGVSHQPSNPKVSTSQKGRRRRQSFLRRSWWEQVIYSAPGWWLVALLVLAPWAYGTTFPQTKDLLAGGLLLLIGLYLVSLIVERRRPSIDWLPATLTLLILTQGWVMALNPKFVYDPAVQYFHFVPTLLPWLPGTCDQITSIHQMWLITGLFGAFWVVTDLGGSVEWRERLWTVMSLTGVSLVGLGLLQRITGAPGIFWRGDLDSGPTFFATYRYHANAGAFINIGLLLTAGRMICMFRRDHSDLVRSFWVLAFLSTLVSAFVNVSRAATVIGVLLLCVLFAWELRERTRAKRFVLGWPAAAIALAGVAAAAILVWAVGFQDAYRHWSELGKSLVSDDRRLVYGAVLQNVLPASGWWGFGPGTFHLIFPFFTNSLGTRIQGYWEYAHQDYLETLVEWGVVGAAAWFVFFSQTILRATLTFWQRNRRWDGNTRRFALACFLALGAILIHALVDFPMQIASLQLYTAVLLGLVAAWLGTGGARSHRVRKSSQTTAGEHQASQTALP